MQRIDEPRAAAPDAPATTAPADAAVAAARLVERDRAVLWHPYAPVGDAAAGAPLFPVASASGVRLTLADGREVIDGMSSWWAAIHGYRHPVLDAAAHAQIDTMAHVMFGGLTHEPAVRLAETLVRVTPAPLSRVFFCDSGSVSVEVAIKMALQYQIGRGRPGRTRLLTIRRGYHGDTSGAMAVCDPDTGMHHLFTGLLPRHLFAPAPACGFTDECTEADVAPVARLLAEHAHEVAAVIVEPVLQGAGAMRAYAPAFLARLRQLCDEHEALLIADEIATGFGRTGAFFAAEHAGVSPDVMCVGKALTGGYLSMAATLCTAEVASGISAGAVPVLAHGPTFMGNPLACAVANASIGLLRQRDWAGEVKRIEAGLRDGLAGLAGRPGIADVRVLGAIGVVQLDHPVDVPAATRAAVESGVWLRPFRDLVYAMPPYVATEDDVTQITTAMVAAARAG